MMTTKNNFHTKQDSMRRVMFPYCIRFLPNGTCQVLNRNYSIVGHGSQYNTPITADTTIKIVRLTKKQRALLSWDGVGEGNEIFLYHDGCKPDSSLENWNAYQKRLHTLMRLTISRSE
jgi:hypothetical protein